MGRKIYIDLGAFLGNTIKEFYESRSDANEYMIYAWEPLPKNYAILTTNVGNAGWDNVICMHYAAYHTDCIMPFYSNKERLSDGGTLIQDKMTGSLLYNSPLNIRCKDFCKWFKHRVNPDDYVYLKMNIEGGEYEIMGPMIDTGVLGYIDEFKYWLHLNKIKTGPLRDMYECAEKRFLAELNNHNIKVTRIT